MTISPNLQDKPSIVENTNTSNNNTDSMLTAQNNGNGTSNNGAPGKWAKKNKNRKNGNI